MGLDRAMLGFASALTLLAGIYSYTINAPMDARQLLFVLLVFYAVVATAKWLWSRSRSSPRRKP
jgi:hypothetical protein